MKRALLFGGVPVLAGLALIALWFRANEAASRGDDWTQVLATIETANIQPGTIEIAYRYDYRGRQYRNPSGQLTIREGARSANPATRYATGRQILAYVNPAAPSESMLEPLPRPSSLNVIAGVVLLIIGLPIGTYLLREKPSVQKNKPVRKPSKPLSRLKPPPPAPRK